MPSPSRSHTETLAAIRELAESESADGFFYCCSVAGEVGLTYELLLALLADLQRLEEALEQVRESEMGTNQAHMIANAALAALHREKPDSRD